MGVDLGLRRLRIGYDDFYVLYRDLDHDIKQPVRRDICWIRLFISAILDFLRRSDRNRYWVVVVCSSEFVLIIASKSPFFSVPKRFLIPC